MQPLGARSPPLCRSQYTVSECDVVGNAESWWEADRWRSNWNDSSSRRRGRQQSQLCRSETLCWCSSQSPFCTSLLLYFLYYILYWSQQKLLFVLSNVDVSCSSCRSNKCWIFIYLFILSREQKLSVGLRVKADVHTVFSLWAVFAEKFGAAPPGKSD